MPVSSIELPIVRYAYLSDSRTPPSFTAAHRLFQFSCFLNNAYIDRGKLKSAKRLRDELPMVYATGLNLRDRISARTIKLSVRFASTFHTNRFHETL